jgi:hypothetical protein
MTLQQAIERQEGFTIPQDSPLYPCPAQRNHNPGNLLWGSFAKLHLATGPDDKGRAIFPTDEDGEAALTALLQTPLYKGKSVEAAINEYCPPPNGHALTEGNDPDAYVRDVCSWVPCTPDTVIDGLLA